MSVGGGKEGDKVLIHGASGGVGVACLQIAKFLGMEVHGTASTDAGLSLINDHECSAHNHSQKGYLDKLKENKAGFHKRTRSSRLQAMLQVDVASVH